MPLVMRLCLIFSLLLSTSVYSSLVWSKDQADFSRYLQQLKQEALEQGFDEQFLTPLFSNVSYRETVVSADKNQPEKKLTLDTYLASRVPDWKVKQAVLLMNKHKALLDEIAARYGVQKRFIVALWGNESNFGKIQGKFDVLSALSSLAYEGRRETLFKKQFFAALTILQEGHISADQLLGSWAGAMGQSQFMPTSFLTYAVDYDQDGRKDIWGSHADVFASIANYLSQEGWNDQQTWGRQVKTTVNAETLPVGLGKAQYLSLSRWQELGITRYDGSTLPNVDISASFIMPDGPSGRLYLVYNNFHTLMRWNRSLYFGVSVGYLADRIKRGF